MSELPPNYSDQDRQPESSGTSRSPQIVLTPVADAVHFQTGNLGADGEHAAVEGEVQLKGVNDGEWGRLTVTLKTVETVPNQTIELAASTVELFSATGASSSRTRPLPSSLPFSIHLTDDIPQAVSTPNSSVAHSLTATLYPIDKSKPPIVSSAPVQIRRFTTALSPQIIVAPRTLTFESPTRLSIQLPRAIFRVGEPIPVYVTVPPPQRSVLESDLRLRNLKAELVRVVKVGPVEQKAVEVSSPGEGTWEISEGARISDDLTAQRGKPPLPTKGGSILPPPPLGLATPSTSSSSQGDSTTWSTVVTRSGASCRFHPSRSVQLRLVLHSGNLDEGDPEANPPDVDTAAGSITQSTVMHQISFHVHVELAFVAQSTHTSTSVHGRIPIIIIPALAQQPEVADDLEQGYMKKHDKPPVKTNRVTEDVSGGPPAFDDTISSSIILSQDIAGPSFDPPPFTSEPGGSGLPSFYESEVAAGGSSAPSYGGSVPAELRFPGEGVSYGGSVPTELRFPEEGVSYGFRPEDQYDGISHSFAAPPPAAVQTVADVQAAAELAHLIQQVADTHAMNMVVGNQGDSVLAPPGDFLPPPPPAMDDPMDLPPTIDDRFHSISRSQLERETIAYAAAAQVEHGGDHPHPPPTPGGGPVTSPPSVQPPPYLGETGNVPGSGAPPSYLDSR
ncbi:hypothetical protein FRC03_008646 [Tulasnella sp. 419]|nr:hypothetical protein FRC02_000214 [Tulasnella sp. 418]KAG8970449.1 hypothetical protein FRC03_008646 [Tulasnella sp. 419]